MSTSTQTFRGKAGPETTGVRWVRKSLTVTGPGSEITPISEVVAAATEIYLLSINVTCNMEGVLKVLVNSDVIGSVRTGAGFYNAEFTWRPYHSAVSGDTISVKFKAMGSKPATDIEIYLQGREVPA